MSTPMYARYFPPSTKQSKATDSPNDTPEDPSQKSAKKRKKNRSIGSLNVQSREKGSDRSEKKKNAKSHHKSTLEKFENSIQRSNELKDDSTGGLDKNPSAESLPAKQNGLKPIPQSSTRIKPERISAREVLPEWIANPSVALSDKRTPFTDFNLGDRLLKLLQAKDFTTASSIQSAVFPFLLPGPSRHDGDVCVSAATGSGKTLAYVLPIIQDLQNNIPTELSAIIVLPTKELVLQVKKVFDSFTSKSGIKVEISIGSRPLEDEKRLIFDLEEEEDRPLYSLGYDIGDAVVLCSSCDVLICTPGRLVDHIEKEPCLELRSLKWLVIDEADRLLDNSFQEWAKILMRYIYKERPIDKTNATEQLQLLLYGRPKLVEFTKIVLSATLTQDPEKLESLKLNEPKLVTLDSDFAFTLPSTLKERFVSVGDGSEKPRYLLQILQTWKLDFGISPLPVKTNLNLEDKMDISDSSSNISDLSDSSDSDDSKDSSAESDNSGRNSESGGASDIESKLYGAIIFCRSVSSVLRLERLLCLLMPEYASKVASISSASGSKRKKVLNAFKARKTTIIVATDVLAHGLDIPDLAYVVSYDVPTSVEDYVHRVGRTARAGRTGEAWTLVTSNEAKWLKSQIQNGTAILSKRDTEWVKIKLDKDQKNVYEKAIATLGDEVAGIEV